MISYELFGFFRFYHYIFYRVFRLLLFISIVKCVLFFPSLFFNTIFLAPPGSILNLLWMTIHYVSWPCAWNFSKFVHTGSRSFLLMSVVYGFVAYLLFFFFSLLFAGQSPSVLSVKESPRLIAILGSGGRFWASKGTDLVLGPCPHTGILCSFRRGFPSPRAFVWGVTLPGGTP